MFEEIGDDGEILETEARIAECRMLQGDLEQALAACDASLQRARTIGGVPPQVPLLHRVRGWALVQTGRPDDARRAFEESLRTARSRQADFEIAMALHALAALARQAGGRDEDAERESRTMLERLGVVRVAGVPALKGVGARAGRARLTNGPSPPLVPSACLHPGRRRPATATGTGDPRWTGPSSS